MGKPFKKELESIEEMYAWASGIDIIPEFKCILHGNPVLIVGSGGSYSVCHFLTMILASKGIFAKAITPLELHYSSQLVSNASIVFISASGKNSDILFAYQTALQNNAKNILCICMKVGSKLSQMAEKNSITTVIELNNPLGKDGFLATNSLIGYFAILSKAAGYSLPELKKVNINVFKDFASNLHEDFTIHVLYGGWGQPVAVDIESKFTEAGLGNVLIADYRNFAHGRHNWFDKKRNQSVIISIISPDEQELADKTLKLLPTSIPRLVISSLHVNAEASIDLLIQSFYLVSAIGDLKRIDPGRPGVPPYGSKLYNLKYSRMLNGADKNLVPNAILHKADRLNRRQLTKVEHEYWAEKLGSFKTKMNNCRFGGIIIDYDGTVCNDAERKTQPSKQVLNEIIDFLKHNFMVAIVTGRGKSIRDTLRKCIPENLQKQVMIGYYNGGQIGFLGNNSLPNIDLPIEYPLDELCSMLSHHNFLEDKPTITLRPQQLTIENNLDSDWHRVKRQCLDLLSKFPRNGFEILESGHSIDIIPRPKVSKTNIFKLFEEELANRQLVTNYICIGDKGKYPGNDYELLQHSYSLSVDEVSSDADTCWNLSSAGKKGRDSFLEYLSLIKYNDNYFTISL